MSMPFAAAVATNRRVTSREAGPGADEEAPAQCHRERRAAASANGAYELPGALDAPLHEAREASAARDLEGAEAGRVEQFRELE